MSGAEVNVEIVFVDNRVDEGRPKHEKHQGKDHEHEWGKKGSRKM